MATFVTGRVIQDGTVTTNDLQQGLVIPPGAVMSFAMSAAPVGWLACDGTSKAVSDFQPLFAAIGYTYGGSGSNFNVPNLQGQFVRGLTTNLSTTSRDPLSATRVLGNVQGDEFRSHTHTLLGQEDLGTFAGATTFNLRYNPITQTTNPTGGAETRPVNIALLYCIKT